MPDHLVTEHSGPSEGIGSVLGTGTRTCRSAVCTMDGHCIGGRRSRICFLMERGPQSANRAVNSAVLREHPCTLTHP